MYKRVCVVRTGALGDVLAVRGVLAWLRATRPGVQLCLVAPGERGRFFARPQWADAVLDADRACCAWLHADADTTPPAQLADFFAGAGEVIAFGATTDMAHRLSMLAPAARVITAPDRPADGTGMPIGRWLIRMAGGTEEDAQKYGAASVSVPAPDRSLGLPERYVALHPGSGSARKNWPLERFAALAPDAARLVGPDAGVVVVSGEADRDLGQRLATAVPGAVHISHAPLQTVAEVVAHAALYIGNDSGVSHLAGAVMRQSGTAPRVVTFFGPTDPGVWAPPGALVLPDMNALSPVDALQMIASW